MKDRDSRMVYSNTHPYYLKVEEAIRTHLYKYEEPWINRDPMVQDILNALFRDNTIEHGIDIIGDENE